MQEPRSSTNQIGDHLVDAETAKKQASIVAQNIFMSPAKSMKSRSSTAASFVVDMDTVKFPMPKAEFLERFQHMMTMCEQDEIMQEIEYEDGEDE